MRLMVCTLALALASGCATMLSGPDETITVTSEPSGASVSLLCGSETDAGTTPARFVIARKTTDCSVAIEKEGFEKEVAVIEKGVNRWTWLNLPIAAVGIGALGMSGFSDDPAQSRREGGAILLLGLGGLAIDGLTSKLRDHDPKTLHVKLRPSPPAGR